jgi:glyceraldehyde 3-phosphate dehydrogenase
MARIAVNGLGRIGKLALRDLVERGAPGEIALLNDAVGDPGVHAHLFEFDTVHGRWPARFAHDADSVSVNGVRLRLTNAARIEDLPLRDLGIDLVVDCTGVFKTAAKTAPYFDAGVERVVVSAPIRDEAALNLVYGVNHHLYDPARHRLVTAASCTTNCLAPVVKVLHESVGIRHGSITTIHDVTNTQTMVDRPASDLRRAVPRSIR